jgi:hypothetical protein
MHNGPSPAEPIPQDRIDFSLYRARRRVHFRVTQNAHHHVWLGPREALSVSAFLKNHPK